jgi:hypothetical protein
MGIGLSKRFKGQIPKDFFYLGFCAVKKSQGGGVMSKTRNTASEDGRKLGKWMAEITDAAEPKARLKLPDLPPRCASCAFRHGKHVANGSPATQMDALKCVLEGVEFQCHDVHRVGEVCSGWAMNMLAQDEFKPRLAPWEFSVGTDDPK